MLPVAVVIVLLIIGVALAIVLTLYPHLWQSNQGQASQTPPKPTGPIYVGPLVGKFNADDRLTIQINGKDVAIPQVPDWTAQHIIEIPNVKTGDVVDFIVENKGGPGGFIGLWSWNGKSYAVNNTTFPGMAHDNASWQLNYIPYYENARWTWSSDRCEVCKVKFTWVAN